jgi:hypothetical protein
MYFSIGVICGYFVDSSELSRLVIAHLGGNSQQTIQPRESRSPNLVFLYSSPGQKLHLLLRLADHF